MSQVRFAISPARNQALVDSRTMTRLRSEFRVEAAYQSSASICWFDKVFACLPGIFLIDKN